MLGYLQVSYAYFGGGAARRTEVHRLHSYALCTVNSGRLHFQMQSKKGGRHGVDRNKMVDHWLPPSVTRRVVLIEYILEKKRIPRQDEDQMREFFRKICGFEQPVSIKDARQFIASIYNTVCGSTQTVIAADAAAAFHHSVETHNAFYSDTVKNGELRAAMQFWTAVGEPPSMNVSSFSRRIPLSAIHLTDALQSLFGPGAKWQTRSQQDAVNFVTASIA